MRAITELTSEQFKEYSEIAESLHHLPKVYKDVKRMYGYAHYAFEGTINEEFIEATGRLPTPDEIIIAMDRGFSHFGATCSIDPVRKTFCGRVNTD